MSIEKIIFFPDYSGGNPYQKLLYKPCKDAGLDVESGDISKAISEQEKQGSVVFHLHWLNAIFKNCDSEVSAWSEVGKFLRLINKFQRLGGKVIWTIHNHLPHEKKYAEQDLRLRHFLCQSANRIHLHCATHVKELNYLPLRIENVHIHRHGNYLGYYGDFDIKARISDIENNGKKFLFLGMLRGYKDIDSLIDKIDSIRSVASSITIAGNPETPEIKEKIERFCKKNNISYVLRRVTENEVHRLCSDHNFGVLSYDKILTSGTLKLYTSYGMAILAPDLQTVRAEDRYNSFVYDSDYSFLSNMQVSEHIDMAVKSYLSANESRWSYSIFENIN